MRIAFRNEHFAAVDKPAGWLSVPGRFGAADPRPCAGLELQARLGQRVWPVHRLDAEVSGLLLFALSADAHRAAGAWFERREAGKRYEARTEGDARGLQPAQAWEWRSRLLRGKKRSYESPRGREAATRARFDGRDGEWLAWRLEPLTGRPHQLRVHLAAHGFPIAGDVLYGATRPWPAGGIALRAVRLEFSRCRNAGSWGLPEALEVGGLGTGGGEGLSPRTPPRSP